MAASSSTDTQPLVRSLRSEHALLARILKAHKLQHGRAPYYHQLRGALKRLVAADERCAPAAIELADGPAAACVAIERALNAIPGPWLKLRHLLAQTYFMPFALAGLAVLSRSATLLASLHSSLGGARKATAPLLLALAQPLEKTDAVLDKIFGDVDGGESPPPAPTDSQPSAEDNGDGDDDDVGEPVVDVDSLIYIDPLPADAHGGGTAAAAAEVEDVEDAVVEESEEEEDDDDEEEEASPEVLLAVAPLPHARHQRPARGMGQRSVHEMLQLGSLWPRG